MRSAADGIALWWLLVVTSVDAFRRKKTTCFSLRSQQLLLVAYLARYVDVCWNFTSLNMTMIKVHSIVAASLGTVLLSLCFDSDGPFPRAQLGVCALLGLLINQDHTSLFEMSLAASLYLEASALLPQKRLLAASQHAAGQDPPLLFVMILLTGQLCSFLSWYHRIIFDVDYVQRMVWSAGLARLLILGYFVVSVLAKKLL